MFQREDIERLARLSRLAVSDAEAVTLAGEIDAVIGYVSEVQSAPGTSVGSGGDMENVMRPDADPHEPGAYTDTLLSAAPKSRDGYVVVKKIL